MAKRARNGAVTVAFEVALWRHPGKGGWHFAPVPAALAPSWSMGWGRTPVVATVDGHTCRTSVWRGRNGRVELAVPRRVRGAKGDGDVVAVRLTYARSDDD
jgi:hypothetical protein